MEAVPLLFPSSSFSSQNHSFQKFGNCSRRGSLINQCLHKVASIIAMHEIETELFNKKFGLFWEEHEEPTIRVKIILFFSCCLHSVSRIRKGLSVHFA